MNERIRANTVRVIDENGGQLGVLPLRDALALARGKGLDLVAVGLTAVPPICKIMNYSKYKYEKAKSGKKHPKIIRMKEMRMSPTISPHDLEIKKRHMEEFIKDGHRVKVTVVFRGREMSHTELGRNLLTQIKEYFGATAVCEKDIRMDGRRMTVVLFPKK